MKTSNRNLAIFGALALLLASGLRVRAATNEWRYDVLAQDKVVKAGDSLLEFESIDVAGFRTARLFVQIMQSDAHKNQGKFTRDAKLRVACFHNTKTGSSHYFEKEIPMEVKTNISGWVEIPVIGPELRVIVWGDNIPKTELNANCSIYLLK